MSRLSCFFFNFFFMFFFFLPLFLLLPVWAVMFTIRYCPISSIICLSAKAITYIYISFLSPIGIKFFLHFLFLNRELKVKNKSGSDSRPISFLDSVEVYSCFKISEQSTHNMFSIISLIVLVLALQPGRDGMGGHCLNSQIILHRETRSSLQIQCKQNVNLSK